MVLSQTRSGKKSGQNAWELEQFIKYANEQGVRRYLEIGARYGDTFWEVMNSLPKGSHGVCVDMVDGWWGESDSYAHLDGVCRDLRERGYSISMFIGNSQDKFTLHKVSKQMPCDLVLIDADHTYNGVKTDFENYSGFARHVAFHDIVGHGQRHSKGINVEVPQFWQEIKNDTAIEFVDEGSKMGIGVMRV